jgi:phosphatidylglycerol lysyltransferase
VDQAAPRSVRTPHSARWRSALPPIIGLALFIAALEVLRTELRASTWHAVSSAAISLPHRQLALALLFTTLNYAVLTVYDFLAFAYIGKRLPARQVALTSFLSYAIANNVGWAMLSGASVRYRFYSRLGVTGEQLARIVFAYSVTFWLGLLLLGGLSLATGFLPGSSGPYRATTMAAIGWVLVAASLGYVAATFVRREPIRLPLVELPLPSPQIAVAQLVTSAVDWMLAAAVLYVLLPPSPVSFFGVLGAFAAAQLVGLASHVPGGVGVFEGLIVILLKPHMSSDALVPALIVYRAVYYLLPLGTALIVLVADELHLRRAQAARVGAALSRMTGQLTPRVLAAFTFLSGIVLLYSGATPAAAGRLAVLDRIVPLGVIETSHFVGSVVGAALLVLSQGLVRRLDAAYFLTAIALAVGIAASLLKGGDYEEATLLAVALGILWRARPAFDRRAALFETRFTPGWIVAITGAVAGSIWLGLFAFKHVEYSNELWWQFELRGEASRFLRASVAISIGLVLFAAARLLGHAPHPVAGPTGEELAMIDAIIPTQTSTVPYLVYLRDKAVLFDQAKQAFLMYGVQGRTWVALGDPVGATERFTEVIRAFLERCDDFGGVPVFYEVRKDSLYRYADFGLAFVKLGEDATVDLQTFTLEGGQGRRLRQALRRLEHERATFRVVPQESVSGILEQLKRVSDDWLSEKRTAEKGFSLGFFDPDYLSRFPVGVIEKDGEVVAFGSIWPGPRRVELSVDLMRYHHRAPKEVMEGLFVHLIGWAKEQGYQRFSLGIAPLSGFERSSVTPLWNRIGAFLYEHGDTFYNFQGLRAYKEKFHPAWEPRYLVYPGGMRLPRILADVAALVAGGYRRILLK